MGASAARIGPNSILQTVDVVQAHHGAAAACTVLAASGYAAWCNDPPTAMVPEEAFHALAATLVAQYGDSRAAALLIQAGEQTASYLLAHRIPRPFQAVLRRLPPVPALAALLAAVRFNAWTFVGSGDYRYTVRHPAAIVLTLRQATVPAVVHFFGGTFALLLRELVDDQTALSSHALPYAGGLVCTYQVRLPGRVPTGVPLTG